MKYIGSRQGEQALIAARHSAISALHQRWAGLEDEYHQLEITMKQTGSGTADLESLRQRQVSLLLEISAVVAEMRDAPAVTLDDYVALLDVAIEHEIDLAGDIGVYGPADFPMIIRLLRALAERVPGFEFNSLKRWLSSPGQYEELFGRTGEETGCGEPVGFGRA